MLLSQNALVAESITSFDESSNPIFTNTNVQQLSDTTTSIPEPTSVLGVLAVGLWGCLSWPKKAKRAVNQDEQS